MNPVTHPLELVFDLEQGSTATAIRESQLGVASTVTPTTPPTDPVTDPYDTRDQMIERELEFVRTQALSLASTLQGDLEYADAKQKARLGEVTVQALQAALDASKQKAANKQHKDKLRGSTVVQSTVTNNTVIVDRRELLRQARETIDVTPQ